MSPTSHLHPWLLSGCWPTYSREAVPRLDVGQLDVAVFPSQCNPGVHGHYTKHRRIRCHRGNGRGSGRHIRMAAAAVQNRNEDLLGRGVQIRRFACSHDSQGFRSLICQPWSYSNWPGTHALNCRQQVSVFDVLHVSLFSLLFRSRGHLMEICDFLWRLERATGYRGWETALTRKFER